MPLATDWTAEVSAVAAAVAVAVTALGLYLTHGRSRAGETKPDAGPVTRSHPDTNPASEAKLVIGNDGHFVGGDDKTMALQVVVDLLERPLAERRVEVHATVLDDPQHRLHRRRQLTDLRQRVAVYERCVNALMRGAVHYPFQFHDDQLAGAIIELRRLALPPWPDDRQSWFAWSASAPGRSVEVKLTDADVESLQEGTYAWDGGDPGPPGVPDDQPIWLTAVWPRIAWEHVAPAALFAATSAQPNGLKTPIDLADWVLSRRGPDDVRSLVPEGSPDRQEPWQW